MFLDKPIIAWILSAYDEQPARRLQRTRVLEPVSEARYFHLNCRQIADPRLVVICGGRETCAPDYFIDRVTFPYYGIEWVERGKGEVWLEGQWFPLVPSSIFCYGPGISYPMRTDPEQVMTKCFPDFAGEEAGELPARASALPGARLHLFNSLELSEVYEGLYREGMRQGRGDFAVSDFVLCLSGSPPDPRRAGVGGRQRGHATARTHPLQDRLKLLGKPRRTPQPPFQPARQVRHAVGTR
jgi:hypothetical protein